MYDICQGRCLFINPETSRPWRWKRPPEGPGVRCRKVLDDGRSWMARAPGFARPPGAPKSGGLVDQRGNGEGELCGVAETG